MLPQLARSVEATNGAILAVGYPTSFGSLPKRETADAQKNKRTIILLIIIKFGI
jgi:hypothetical protein